jgi:hypothetical protein
MKLVNLRWAGHVVRISRQNVHMIYIRTIHFSKINVSFHLSSGLFMISISVQVSDPKNNINFLSLFRSTCSAHLSVLDSYFNSTKTVKSRSYTQNFHFHIHFIIIWPTNVWYIYDISWNVSFQLVKIFTLTEVKGSLRLHKSTKTGIHLEPVKSSLHPHIPRSQNTF